MFVLSINEAHYAQLHIIFIRNRTLILGLNSSWQYILLSIQNMSFHFSWLLFSLSVSVSVSLSLLPFATETLHFLMSMCADVRRISIVIAMSMDFIPLDGWISLKISQSRLSISRKVYQIDCAWLNTALNMILDESN